MARAATFALLTIASCAAADGHVHRVPWRDTPYPDVPASLGERFERLVFSAPDGASIPYRAFVPPRIAASSRLPLVVVLHGSGAIGDDNEKQLGPFARAWAMPEITMRHPAIVVVPQAASRSANYEPWRDGELASTVGPSAAGLFALLDELVARNDVDRDRVYLVGFSMGGSAALQAVLARPDVIAGVVVFSGVAPPRDVASVARATPAWFVHGDADSENPIGSIREWTTALVANGAAPRVVVHVGMDHRVPADALLATDWRDWLFAQRRR